MRECPHSASGEALGGFSGGGVEGFPQAEAEEAGPLAVGFRLLCSICSIGTPETP